jgi:NAD(P)-dependent dehydrogenase (short-subunit alcohol dehydrogenase family)
MAALTDRVVLVTGGGRELGREISLAFARQGAHLVIAGRSLAPLEETAAEIRAEGRRCLPVVTDITDEAAVISLFRRAAAEFDSVDVLVNNAAAERRFYPVAEMPLAEWNNALAVKLTGAMLCSREALRIMVPRGKGVILNISGTTAVHPAPFMSHHSVGQSGLISLARALAGEVGKHGIRVNAIVPSAVEGETFRRIVAGRPASLGPVEQDPVRAQAADSPLGRLVQPHEVGALAVFLASDDASGITGQAFNILLENR